MCECAPCLTPPCVRTVGCVSYGVIFDATVQTCIFDSNGGAEREGSGRRLLANETTPKPAGWSAVASECETTGLNETRQARQELAALANEVAKMKAVHSAEIAGLKDELRREIQAGREESQRAQAETRELLLQLLAERKC